MRQRPPFVLHTSELAGGGRPRRAFPGKMELRWVAWYVVRTVGGGGGGRCTEEARDTRHARDGGGGRGGGQKAREQTPCSLSHSLPPYRLHASTLGWILSSPHAHSSVAYAERRVRPTDKCVAWIEILCTQGIKARERALRRRRSCSWPSTSARSASLRGSTKIRSRKI